MRRQGLLSVALLGVALSAAEEACTTLLTPVTRYGKEGEGPGEINTAFHAVGARGHVFVSDFWNHRIQVFTLDGEFHKTIGGKGTAPGRLMFPMGMAVLDDELYVTEGLNHRVQVFTLDGEPIRSFGEQGTGDGQVNYPPAIALSDEAAYVTDRANERVVVFERRTGAFARVIGADGATFAGVMGVAFDAGELFVTDRGRVQVFDADGALLRELRAPELAAAVGVAVAGARVYVSVAGADSGVRVLSRATGALLGAVPLPGGSRAPYLLSADERGLLAADGEAHFAQRLLVDPPAPLLAEALRFGALGGAEGELNYPYQAVASAASGEIFVADQFNHRISVFSARGAFVRAFAGMGSGEGQFMYPVRGAASRSSAAAAAWTSPIPRRPPFPVLSARVPPPRARRWGSPCTATRCWSRTVPAGASRCSRSTAPSAASSATGASGAPRAAPRARCRTRWASSSATARPTSSTTASTASRSTTARVGSSAGGARRAARRAPSTTRRASRGTAAASSSPTAAACSASPRRARCRASSAA